MYFNDFINLEILIIIKMKNKEKKRYLKILIENIDSEVVFMIEFLMFLIIGLMISTTINVALLTIIFIQWTNKE